MKMTAEHVFEIIGSIICVPRSHREELDARPARNSL